MKHTTSIRKGLKIMTAVLLFSLPVTVSAADGITAKRSGNDQTFLSYSIYYSTKEKGILVVRKKGCNDWSYIVQDSTGAIILSRNCATDNDTIFGLTEGYYTISEVNPYGIGTSQSFKLNYGFRTKFCNIPSEERSLIRLTEENDWTNEIEQNSAIQHSLMKMRIELQELEKNNTL